MNKVLGVDFDNTLVISRYPEIIAPNIPVIKYVNYKHSQGYKIIIDTCRSSKEDIEAVKQACEKYEIYYDFINENDPERVDRWGDSRKIGVDEYIDDTCKVTVNQIVEAYEKYGEAVFIDKLEKSSQKPNYRIIFDYINSIIQPKSIIEIYNKVNDYDINYFELISILDELVKQNKILCIVSKIDDTYKFRSNMQLNSGYSVCGEISPDTYISLCDSEGIKIIK